MSVWEGLVLGLVQGLTEFLPVSSSGHLVLTGALLGVVTPGVFVEVAVHVATLVAVLIVFGRRLATLVRAALRGQAEALRYLALLALGSLPAGLVGVLLKAPLERAFHSLWWAGAGFLISGSALWLTRRRAGGDVVAPAAGAALAVGAAQALAILPGVSRSGMTISAGLWMRLTPPAAAEFGFLLAVPAIAGAAALELPNIGSEIHSVGLTPLLASCGVALGSGIVAIRWLLAALRRGRLHAFAPYCWAVGLFTLGFALWRS